MSNETWTLYGVEHTTTTGETFFKSVFSNPRATRFGSSDDAVIQELDAVSDAEGRYYAVKSEDGSSLRLVQIERLFRMQFPDGGAKEYAEGRVVRLNLTARRS